MDNKICMFIAGDPSGDHHTAPVIGLLKSAHPDVTFTGIGGRAMEEQGFVSLMPFAPFNRMGFIEVVRHLPFFLKAKKSLISWMRVNKPACLVCVDYSGFNPMMKAAHKLGIPVVWFIAPMVWAYKKKRAQVLAQYAAHICCIFPFEVPYFTSFTKSVSFVGNPLVDGAETVTPVVPHVCESLPKMRIAFVPGSRQQEVATMIPVMAGAFKELKKRWPDLTGVISRYHTLDTSLFVQAAEDAGLTIFDGALSDLLAMSDFAVVTSGTATLETALAGKPHVVVYKTSFISYEILKRLLKVKYIGLSNIIAEETVAPELIQQYVTIKDLSDAVSRFIATPELYNKTARRLVELKAVLGSQSASKNVTHHVELFLR
jgi:lipid-A-disaccharide synthase